MNNMNKVESDFMNVEELAKRLGIGKSKCYQLVKSEDLPFEVLFVGDRILISRLAYERFVESMGTLKYKVR